MAAKQLPLLAGLPLKNGGAIFRGVQPVQKVMRSNPRIAPAVQGTANYFATEVPVVALSDGLSCCFVRVETVDYAATPGGCLTTQRRGEGRGGCRGGGNLKFSCVASGQRKAPTWESRAGKL